MLSTRESLGSVSAQEEKEGDEGKEEGRKAGHVGAKVGSVRAFVHTYGDLWGLLTLGGNQDPVTALHFLRLSF